MPGLDASGFTAEEGIKDGRQQGGHADASDPAITGRLEFRRFGVTAGGSFWYGGSGFGLVRLDIEPPKVGVASLDARYRRDRHELRGQWSLVNISGAGDLNGALQANTGINPNIASRLLGAYGGIHSVVLAVHAPFGSDAVLSRYPDSQVGIPIQRQVLVKALQRVAREGVHVSALIDLHDDDSYLVEIPALQPKAMRITSVWKQDMTSPRALAGFLRRTHAVNPCSTIVLALEGHGAGYLPEIDAANLTPEKTTSNGAVNARPTGWVSR